jgi:hypothetical protein
MTIDYGHDLGNEKNTNKAAVENSSGFFKINES